MSTVEAAASLFGSDGDSGPDPFAVIGNEVTDTTPPHDEHQTHNSSHSFQMGQDTSSWFAEQMYPDAQQDQHDRWFIPTAQDASAGQSHHPRSQPSSYDHQQRYNPGVHVYERHPAYNSPSGRAVSSTAPQASYESYNPAAPAHHQPYNPSQYLNQQPHDPYMPIITTSDPYAPRQPAKQLSAMPGLPQAAQPDDYSAVSRPLSSPHLASFGVASPQQPPNGVPAQVSKLTAAEFRPKTSNAYDPPLPPPKVHRTTSPSSLRFAGSSHGLVSHISPMNPYDHKSMPEPPRTMSPSPIRPASPASSSFPSSRTIPAYTSAQLQCRSISNGSTLSSQGVVNPVQPRKEYGLGFGAHIAESSSYNSQSQHFMEQDTHVSRNTRLPYAPSPSLLGSNDPLGRTSCRAPVISFGFGGKVLTCFHNSANLNTGFDVALSSRHTTNVTIRVLHQLLPDYVSEAKATEYPGPLFSDPSTPVTSLVRTGTSQAKTKKARVIKYLEERAEGISRGTIYISDDVERQRLEGKLVLARLLKIMVENDGSLSGSPAIDNAVRTALLPRISGTMEVPGHDGPVALSTPAFTSPIPNVYGATSMLSAVKETPISVSTLLPSALDKIQEFLVRGERRQAYHYALDQRLWAHAMIIASSVDKEAWREVVNEFLKAELGVHETLRRVVPHVNGKGATSLPTNGREWLRVTYSVFSGQGPTAVQELVPMNLLSRAASGPQVPASMSSSHITPVSPSFSSTAGTQIPAESLSKWPEIAASIVSGPLNPEYSATLSALGDCLLSHHFIEGAHICYLLSPQTSMMGGLGGPNTRLVLLGSPSPHINPGFFRDPDPIIFTEIAEYALSLKTPIKGQEPFYGFPHLQAYKFTRAAYLADIGHVQGATRYCEAITAIMARPSPYFTPALIEGLRQLADRLLGSPNMDKSTSWIGGKVNKPSLDSIGNWLEVRLTKFIAGEGNETFPANESLKPQFAGPFSSYSSISSATTSASPSPPPTVISSHATSAAQPPRRSGSAMALPSTTMHTPVDRASSAMEYYRPTRHTSPAPPKTAPLQSTEYRYSPHVHQASGPPVANGYATAYGSEPPSRKASLEMTAEEGSEAYTILRDQPNQHEEDHCQPETVDDNQETQSSGGWWNSLSNTDSAPTPTVATFHRVENVREFGDGFISLMDDSAISVASNATMISRQLVESNFDEEDLGLGNSARRRTQDVLAKMTKDDPLVESDQDTTKADGQRDPQQPPVATSAGSWFSRLWKRSDTPGPIKASLGEETSFYYDKELKRWVNKKAGTEAAQPSAPPPPPSRAQTASPSVSSSRLGGTSNGTIVPLQPPPPRTASAIDLSTSPTPKASMRVRSHLVPTEVASMPNTPAPSNMAPPPMGRSRSQAAKKNVRSRYVDVFQHDGP